MILELDTSILDKEELTLNQLVLLSLVSNGNQNNNHNVSKILSQIGETEIQDLINKNLITVNSTDNHTIYIVNEMYEELKKPDKIWFDEFYELYPIYVTRPDGTKGFLRTNVNKCRQQYNKICGKSSAMHEYLLKCLKYDISTKTMQGKLAYMKTMWKWLTTCEWEVFDEQMNNEANTSITNSTYGTELY